MNTRFPSINLGRILSSLIKKGPASRKPAREPFIGRVGIEPLEPRQLMSTYTVNSLIDNLPTTTGTLRWAVTQANLAAGNTINFQAGLTGSISLSHGALNLTQNLSILGPGAANVTINADTTTGQVFSVQKTATVTIDGLTLAQANASAINNLGTLTITNSAFPNDASATGGAINNSGSLNISNSQFTNDTANGFHGLGGAISSHGLTLSLTNTVFSGNSASNFGTGGAIAITAGSLAIANCTFTNNTAKTDGAAISNTTTGTIKNSTFTGSNSASNSEMLLNSGTLVIDSCSFSGNSSAATSHPGGAIANTNSLAIINSTITGNSVDPASTISSGGGIYNSKNLVLTNCTIADNSAKTGGGIACEVTGIVSTIINNTIVAQNAGGDVSGTLNSTGSANLIGDGSGHLLSSGKGNILGSTSVPIDPRLAPLANNGGRTPTMALLASSPALNRGANALALDYLANALVNDQRGTGFPRIVDSTVDIGAYEAPSSNATTTNLFLSTAATATGQPVTLIASVTSSAAPTGNITFFDGATSIGTATLAAGNGQFTISTLAAGTHSITASYAGDSANAPSVSTAKTLTITVTSPNSTILSFNPANPGSGAPVTLSATVTAISGTPTGSVTFLDGTATLGVGTLTSGVATFTTNALLIGAHPITAVYPGSGGFPASTSATKPLYVGSPNQRFVAQLYRDLLGREVDPSGLNSWTTVLSAGQTFSQVATAITSSREYDGIVVDNFYFTLLGRHAETAGLTAWVNQMQTGLNAEVIRAGILGSDEYYNRTGPGNVNGTDATFITALYTTFLGRSPDAGGLAAWEGVLAGIPANRQTVAKGISNSDENRTVIITGFFQTYLHRAPDAGGLAAWKGLLAGGISQPSIISAFVTSPEYLGRLGITG